MNFFQKKILKESEKKKTKLILNLQTGMPITSAKDQAALLDIAYKLCRDTRRYITGVKINRLFADAVGFLNVKMLTKEIKLPFIADFRCADVASASVGTARQAFNAGFEAITMHGFVGAEPLQEVMKNFSDKGVLMIVDMAHPSSTEFIQPNMENMCMLAKNLGVAGVVAPRTKPHQFRQIRTIVGKDILIFGSGLGGEVPAHGDAIRAGADFETVGTFLTAKDPAEEVIKLVEQMRE
jgi:orotidine-5'-phosphate decarboxylase